MAAEMVCVSPGMLDTKVMVAPNSPSALAKHSTMPAITPGSASGKVMGRTRRAIAPWRAEGGGAGEKGAGALGPERRRRVREPPIDRLHREADGAHQQG